MPSELSNPVSLYPQLTPTMIEGLEVFLDLVEPGVFRDQLVQLYLKYLGSAPQELPEDFTDMTESFGFLLQLLTRLEEELRSH